MKKFENWATRVHENSPYCEEGVLDHLKRMNKQGWELVAVLYGTIPSNPCHEFYWKREVTEPTINPLDSVSVPGLPCEPLIKP